MARKCSLVVFSNDRFFNQINFRENRTPLHVESTRSTEKIRRYVLEKSVTVTNEVQRKLNDIEEKRREADRAAELKEMELRRKAELEREKLTLQLSNESARTDASN